MQVALDFHPIGPIWWVGTGLSGRVCLGPVCLEPVCLDPVCLGPVCLDPVRLDPDCLDPVCLDPVCQDSVRLDPVSLKLSNLLSRILLPTTRLEAHPTSLLSASAGCYTYISTLKNA